VDNIIDQRTMGELCQALSAKRFDFEIFYEVKANLTRSQLELLRRAGVNSIQPGIESLSTHVLALMSKGSDLLINLRTLKWAQHLRMTTSWSILTGFPGETITDYRKQAALIPLLHHLPPPAAVSRLWLERFSPYFTQPTPAFTNITPRPAYAYAYPIDIDLDSVAYFFDYDVTDAVAPDVVEALKEAVAQWKAAWSRPGGPPVLTYFRGPGWLRIVDSRGEELRKSTLTGASAAVLDAIDDTFHSVASIATAVAAVDPTFDDVAIGRTLAELIDAGWVVEDNGHYFSLVLPVRRP
jgi:ribosomal peptide maturation radical SAM protein 1